MSTKVKTRYQYKNLTLNSAISIDQERNGKSGSGGDDALFLADILSEDKDFDITKAFSFKEDIHNTMTVLWSKLSKFEKYVLILYLQKYSYEEIAELINCGRKRNINIKSIDNALSRIKIKGKDIDEKFFGEEKKKGKK